MKNVETSKTNSMFTIDVRPLPIQKTFPLVQSAAWARINNKLLLIGGRLEGFHGQSESDTIFKTSKANTSLYVMNLDNFSYGAYDLAIDDPDWLQFTSSNMEFYQEGDVLYLVGGYGRSKTSSVQSDFTFDRITAVHIPTMIDEIEKGTSGNPKKAITGSATDPVVQVAGGELFLQNGIFYLMFGQNYIGAYKMGVTGQYTDAVRTFRFDGTKIYDKGEITNSVLHRRDLNVATVIQSQGPFFVGYGGVFTPDNNGFVNPVRIYPNSGQPIVNLDTTMSQKTSQYACALASVYDPACNTNTHVLFGGIGRYQFHTKTQQWEDGDMGAALPFVNTITQMKWNNGEVEQYIQLPPAQPCLPKLLGANALFIANTKLTYTGSVIDFSKLDSSTNLIGYLYGGILSVKPTSSAIYPTSVNPVVYEVILIKNDVAA